MKPLISFREAAIPAGFAAAAIVGLMAFGCEARAAGPSGSLALTSDYVWRGTSQTQEAPAVQAGLKFAADTGAYASAWGSNVEFAPGTGASSEFDIAVGYGRTAGDWAFDVNVLRYVYPGTEGDLDWTELNGSLTWRDRYWLAAGWSPEALGSGENGTYLQAGARFPVGDAVRVEAAVGHYLLDDVYGDRYTHAQLGAVWTVRAPLELRVTAHATDSSAERLFGRELAGHRIEAAVQASF